MTRTRQAFSGNAGDPPGAQREFGDFGDESGATVAVEHSRGVC
jgi:hypothetical protein